MKSLEENFEKTLRPKGYLKGVATGIEPISSEVRGVGINRGFVKNIYAAKLGQVLKPERVDNNYVVAVVTEVFDEGTTNMAVARPYVESALRNKKKADIFRQKLEKVTTLEAAAAAWGKPIETADSLRMNGRGTVTALGYEPIVNGAAFNPNNKGKVVPEILAGINGVYVVRVESLVATPVTEANVVEQRKGFYQQSKQYAENPQSPAYPVSALKKGATIKDNRADKF